MIAIHYVDRRYVPIIICDVCEKRIVNGGLGAVVYPLVDSDQSEILPCLHAHKGACHEAAEKKFGGEDNGGWDEMQTHFLYLLVNTQLPPAMLAKLLAFLEFNGYFGRV